MTQLTDNIYAVPVPEGAHDFVIQQHCVRNAIDERDSLKLVWESQEITHNWIILRNGSYEFLFCTSEVTEEQARKVVLKDGIFCRNYSVKNNGHPFGWTDDPLESLETLLASKGCEGNQAVVRRK